MRGFPPLHILAFALAFALFAVPLARLTFARPSPVARQSPPATSEAETTPTLLRLRLAHTPETLSVTLNGKELLKPDAVKNASAASRVNLDIPTEGLELLVNATWPTGTPDTAVTIELEPDGLDSQSQTRWSSGSTLQEPFSYYWKP